MNQSTKSDLDSAGKRTGVETHPLMRVIRLPGIHHDANATLVIGSTGTMLIDVGTSWYQLLIEERIIGQIGDDGAVDAILLTSRRFNHCGGAAAISAAFADAPIYLESGAASALAMGDFASTGARRFDSEMPRTITEAVLGGQVWDLGDCTIVAISLPGHTTDGMAYWIPKKGIAAVGSLVPRAGHPSRWDLMGGCLPDLADSIEALLDLNLEMLIPGFGDAVMGKGYVRAVLEKHLSFFEQCIEDDGQPPNHWQRPAQMVTYLTPRTPWVFDITEEE